MKKIACLSALAAVLAFTAGTSVAAQIAKSFPLIFDIFKTLGLI